MTRLQLLVAIQQAHLAGFNTYANALRALLRKHYPPGSTPANHPPPHPKHD